ncbi:MAG: hypothetical protein JKY53_02355 [Flavobacteriales bacterium]|nr:hypothetical protein [Flavobacteriales bacterium]
MREITFGPVMSRSITSYAYFLRGGLIELTAKVTPHKYFSIPVEFGYSSFSQNTFLTILDIQQRGIYYKIGLETNNLTKRKNWFNIGVTFGHVRIEENRSYVIEGRYYDDYREELYDGTRTNFNGRVYASFRFNLGKYIVLNPIASFGYSEQDGLTEGGVYYQPGFGYPILTSVLNPFLPIIPLNNNLMLNFNPSITLLGRIPWKKD